MSPERNHQRVDARSSDECQHQIDAIRRRNLRLNLMPHSRLARRIRQKRRVEQRNQRSRNVLWAAVRQLSSDTAQHGGRLCQLHRRELIGTNVWRDELNEQAGELDSLDAPVLGGYILDGRLDSLCYVQRDSIRSLGVAKFVDIRSSRKLRMPQLLLEKLRHQELVESLREGRHPI